MATTFVPISTADAWVTGQTYQMVYNVDHIKLFGFDIPDELIPTSIRESLAKKQIGQTVEKLSNDPRLEVVGYEFEGRTFTVTVIARDNPIPVAVIVGAIIGLALLFGIAMTTREVRKLVTKTGDLLDKHPITGGLGIGTIAAVVGVGAFFLLKARA